MSAEFRPRQIGEYLDVVRKRKWLILLPTIAVGLAISYVVYRLPDIYESTTLIVVSRQRCPTLSSQPSPRNPDPRINQHLAGGHQPQFFAAADGEIRPVQRRAPPR